MLLDDLPETESYCWIVSSARLEAGAVAIKEGETSEVFGASIVWLPSSDAIRILRRCRFGVRLLGMTVTFRKE